MSRESISSFIRSSKQNSLNTLLLKKKLKFSKTNPKKSLFNRESVLKKVEKTHKTAFYHVISNLYIVKKFISIMKNLTSFRKPKWLKKLHFTIINDLSFDYETFQQFSNETKNEKIKKLPSKNIFLSFFFNLSGKAIKILPIFDPTKKISIVWDSINILVMCFYFVVIPLDISFDEFDDIALIITIKMIFLLILFFDIFKSCFSSYYYKGVLVKDRRTILSHYFKSKFCIDCLTIIPLIFNQILLEIMFENDYWYFKVLQLVFFFKAGRFTYTLKKLVELVFIDSTIQNIISLIKLIIRIVLLAHILACIWFLIGKNQLYPEKNWISAYNLKDSEWSLQYLYAYYFVCVTMNTVGFGDITPQNPLEEVFVIIFIFVGCGIFAYSLNSIGIIVGDIWKRENEFTKDMSQINRFMKEKNINFELKMRVRKYLEYIWKEEKLEEMEEQVLYYCIFCLENKIITFFLYKIKLLKRFISFFISKKILNKYLFHY